MLRLILAAATMAGVALAHDDEHQATIRQMGYLAGDWIETRNGVTVEEHWVGPVGGVMAGVSITHSEKLGSKTSIEFMSIVEKDGTLVFIAQPGGQAPTEFPLKEADNGIATFENPDHDFPQRIIYEIAGEGLNELKARIEGTIDGKARSMDWSYKRLPR